MLTIVRRQAGETESRFVRSFFLLAVVQSLVAAFAGPLLLFCKQTVAAGMIYYLLDHGATRASNGAFYFLGYPLALNARWLGVFCGLLCGLLVYQSVTRSLSKIESNRFTWLRRVGYLVAFLIIIPFIVDCFAGFLDRVLSAESVFLVGYWFGVSLSFYLVPAVSFLLVIIRKASHRFFETTTHLRS